MPRTDFNTIYKQVQPKLQGDLFTLFDSLACYRTEGGTIASVTTPLLLARLTPSRVDDTYCTGSPEAPVSNGAFAALSFTNTASEPPATVNIKDWIQGIGKGDPSPDALSKFDESIDGSIGGLGSQMERMYVISPLLPIFNPILGGILGLSRSVPLFEFRDLQDIKTSQMESFMAEVDSAIQDLHHTFAVAPKRKRDVASSCTVPDSPAEPSPTEPAPPSVAPVDPPSQPSCVPNPTDSVRDAHENALKKAAEKFCHDHATDNTPNGPINVAHTIIVDYRPRLGRAPGLTVDIEYESNMGTQDNVYDISVTSVDNCTPTEGGFNLPTPVADNKCADILHSAWKNCKFFTPPFFSPQNSLPALPFDYLLLFLLVAAAAPSASANETTHFFLLHRQQPRARRTNHRRLLNL